MRTIRFPRRSALLCAVSAVAFSAAPALAEDVQRPDGYELSPGIIVNNNMNPNAGGPDGALDLDGVTVGAATGVTGVGQMTVRGNPASTGLSVCSGTLINPRTVIFAAHCVNTRPADAYGVNGTPSGAYTDRGVPIAFGFGANNLPAVRQWLGLASAAGGTDADPALLHATNENRALYSVEQVWYDPRSLALGFLEADVAIATLDTPAFDVPTWTMLFSPLTEQAHSLSIGYGVNGTSHTAQNGPGCPASASPCGGIDFRRRIASNIVSVLGSLDDRNDFLFGPADPFLFQSLYMQDFDDPNGEVGFNFDIFNGAAVDREGTTAGGDSGGPLVIDQKFSKPVIAGVLSGGSRFFSGQRFSTYGTHSFYQPLFLFWDAIVANNPYVYAGNKAGNGDWEDAGHWVQLMDPNYAVEREGELVNDLPDTPALGVSGDTVKFGEVCFFDDCTDLADDDTATPAPTGSGTGLVIAGGPGSTDFVPNNRSASPKDGIRARYYDVTLSAPGTTTLGSSVTIDQMTVDGATRLDVGVAGSLNVLGEYNQFQGWTHVDGAISSGRDFFVLSGILSGSGSITAPFLTVATGVVAPGGGDKIGTLSVTGDVILASGASLFVDVRRGAADKFAVDGTLSLSSLDLSEGASVVFNKVTDGAAPRHNESFVIATATGSVQGQFGKAFAFQGVLRPNFDYSDPTQVSVKFVAGKFVEILDGSSPVELAFAAALDQLRAGSYANLWNLYGNLDWMNAAQLSATLSSLTPRIVGEVGTFHDYQSKLLTTKVTDRLSLLGSGSAQGLTVIGSPVSALASMTGNEGRMSFGPTASRTATQGALPGKLSGFVSGGLERTRTSYGNTASAAGQGAWHMAAGLEMPLGEGMIGTAAGFAEGASAPGGDNNRSRTMIAAAYAAAPVGSGFYVGGMLSAETFRAAVERGSHDGTSALRLTGATSAARYSAVAEAGRTTAIGRGLTLTPRAQLAYSSYSLQGFEEQGGETALRIEDVNVERFEVRFGAKLEGGAKLGGLMVRPQLSADYTQLLSGRNVGATVRFAAAPDVAIGLPLSRSDAGWAEIKGGVMFGDGPVTLNLSGQHATGGNDLSDKRAQADLTIRF